MWSPRASAAEAGKAHLRGGVTSLRLMDKLLDFLRRLDGVGIRYSLAANRDEAVMVEAFVPGQHWEIEFFADPARVKPGAQGNLILHAYGERPAAGGAKAKAAAARNSLGILPAIPFEMDGPASPRT